MTRNALAALILIFSCATPGYISSVSAQDLTQAAGKAASTQRPDIAAILALPESAQRTAGLQQARAYYEHYVAAHPEDVDALAMLGRLYSWTNNTDLAIITYRNAIRLDDGNLELKTDLARIYRWSQRFSEAELLYKSALQQSPNDHQALKGLAITYLKMGDYSRSQELLDRAIRLYPEDAELHKEQGVLHAWQKRFDAANEALNRAIKLSPEMTAAYTTLGDVHFWNKDYQRAVDAYKQAQMLDPESEEIKLMIAKTYRELRNLPLAEEHAESALRSNPVSAEAKDMLEDIQQEQKLVRLEFGAHYLEFLSMMFVIALIAYSYWKNRRIFRRRHRIIAYSVNIFLPVVTIFACIAFFAEAQFKKFYDIEQFESIAGSVSLIMLGLLYLALIAYAGRHKANGKGDVILAIGAHPDDIELGCGGYILKAKAQGATVYGLTLTKGERGSDKSGVREKEALKSAFFMELDDYWILDFADTQLQDNVNAVKEAIDKVIKSVSPSTVLIHNPYDSHGDHRAAFTATREAARLVPTILCYESVSTPDDFKPDYYVDITDQINDMMRLIRLHKSQDKKSYMDTDLLKGRAAHRGIQSGVPYASAFKVYRIVS